MPRSSKTVKAVQIKALRDSWSRLHEEAELRKWQELHRFAKQSHTNVESINPFSTTSMTAGIILAGQMTPVVVQNLLQLAGDAHHKEFSAETVNTLARETDIQLVDPALGVWKRDRDWLYAAQWLLVCGPSTPNVIGGWALLDDTNYRQQLDNYEGAVLLALHISTRRKVGTANIRFGARRRGAIGRDVFEVLFLEPQEDNRYRRIGVGRIFDDQIIRDFAASEQVEIELV